MIKRHILPALVAAALSGHCQAADTQFSLLVLALPTRYHYEYIPVARESFEKMARLHAFELTWTDQAQAMAGDLSKYAAIVFLNSSGEELDDRQRQGVEQYMRSGGNAVVVHRAIISAPGVWPWYEKLVGRSFRIHPMLQSAVVDKVDASFPATFALPQHWIWSDEWYEFTNPHGMTIHPVLAVDERSYDRPGGRGHGCRPPGELVPRLRERPGLRHGPRPQRRDVQGPAVPRPPLGRHLLERDGARHATAVTRLRRAASRPPCAQIRSQASAAPIGSDT